MQRNTTHAHNATQERMHVRTHTHTRMHTHTHKVEMAFELEEDLRKKINDLQVLPV